MTYAKGAASTQAPQNLLWTQTCLGVAEPTIQKICSRFMSPLSQFAGRVLETGCGNGASTQLPVQDLEPEELIGNDWSADLINWAESATENIDNVASATGDAVDTVQPDDAFDVVVDHTVYSHLADPDSALAEAAAGSKRIASTEPYCLSATKP